MAAKRISVEDLKKARKTFEANEPRDLFYRVATELVDLALRGATSLTVAEALAVLLQTWNKAYYQYRKFDAAHFADIENLIREEQLQLVVYRARRIDELDDGEQSAIENLFQRFESILGPVGAAKTLHLLAPDFFPLWDRAIAQAYDLPIGPSGFNGNSYWNLMRISRQQASDLTRVGFGGDHVLKSIDEYNYCKHSRRWIP